MKIIAIIQARMGSTRLPGKVMREIKGKPLIGYTIDRVLMVPGLAGVVVAIPTTDASSTLCQYVGERKDVILYVGGAENDLVERFLGVIDLMGCDAFVRICGDSPLIDPGLILQAVSALHEGNSKSGFYSNAGLKSMIPGNSVEACCVDTYRMLAKHCEPADREHAGFPFLYRDLANKSTLVDTAEDFERVKGLIEAMPDDHRLYGWLDCANMQ